MYCGTLIWNPGWNAIRTVAYNSPIETDIRFRAFPVTKLKMFYFYYLIFLMNFLPLVVMGSNIDYWQSFRIKITLWYIQRKSLYLEGPDKFNENDNLFLLLKMSALKYWDISSKQWRFWKLHNASFGLWAPVLRVIYLINLTSQKLYMKNLASHHVWRLSGNHFKPWFF